MGPNRKGLVLLVVHTRIENQMISIFFHLNILNIYVQFAMYLGSFDALAYDPVAVLGL